MDDAAVNQAEAEELFDEARSERRAEAKQYVGMGLGLGALGAASAALFGAVCPVCVVAAPALLAAGAIKHVRSRGKR